MTENKDWHLNRIKEEIDAGREQNALSYVSFAISEAATKGLREGFFEAIQIAKDQASLMADLAIEGLPENAREREAMEAALTRFADKLLNTLDAMLPNKSWGYQGRVAEAHHALFHDDPTDIEERLARFFEEANETCQAFGMSRDDAHKLVDYTYDRPTGEVRKEVGAAMLTLASLCVVAEVDLMECAEADLKKLQRPETIARIRAKRATRHGRGPLPGIDPTAQEDTSHA